MSEVITHVPLLFRYHRIAPSGLKKLRAFIAFSNKPTKQTESIVKQNCVCLNIPDFALTLL